MTSSSSLLNTASSARRFRLPFSDTQRGVRMPQNGPSCWRSAPPLASRCRSLCRLLRSWLLLPWAVFFACMAYMASTAVIADRMSYRGSDLQRAAELFPWHRIIQQRAENGRR